jgi:glycosyltransferase involved in cell wall biosynthesis
MNAGRSSGRKLTVAINSQIFFEKGIGGIETVLVGLVHALGRLDGPEQYVIIGPWDNPDWLQPYVGPNQRIVRGRRVEFVRRAVAPFRPILRKARNVLWRAAGVSPTWPIVQKSNGFYEQLGCDVIYFPTPHFIRCALPAVYNPHDLQHLHYPGFFSPEGVIWREKISRAGCELSHTVIAISDWVKRDIVSQYGISPEKVEVIRWGPPTEVHPAPDRHLLEKVARKYALNAPFALFPAMTRVHKNHIRLLEAVALLRDRSGERILLVCTGYQNDFWPKIHARQRDLKLEHQVRFLGMVDAAELRALYRLSQFVVFPSLFEGAGMPVLEAWRDNAPVACSAVTSLPEIAGDAALLFDPTSVDSIADALARMHSDPDLRQRLRRRGAERLRRFDWERTAKHYRAVFRRAAGRPLDDEDRSLLAEAGRNVPTCESV